MKVQEKCLPCIVSQVIKVADMVGLTDKEQLLKKAFAFLSTADYQTMTSPELIGEIFSLLKKEIGNDDPYKATRDKYNHMFMKMIPAFEEKINGSRDPFLEAVKYAIMGNIIDFNPIHNYLLSDIRDSLQRMEQEPLEIDDTKQLCENIKKAKSILYLGDNCGEICLDKIVLMKIKELNPASALYFGTRGEAVVNDSIAKDAYIVGISDYASVISNGDGSMGTIIKRVSKEFLDIYEQADIIIAKGQANYESLSNENKNIYFLLTTKCDVIAKDIGVPEMKMICMRHR